MARMKDRLIEEREMEDFNEFKKDLPDTKVVKVSEKEKLEIYNTWLNRESVAVDTSFLKEQKEAMSIFYKEMDAKLRTRKLNRLADLSVLFLVAVASFGAGALFTRYLVEIFGG